MKEYPQVRKTGVDAVHEKLPIEGCYHEEHLICNVCNCYKNTKGYIYIL